MGTGRPARRPGAYRSRGAAASAAESSAGYPLDCCTVVDSGTTWPVESTKSRSSTEPLIPCR